MTVRNLKHMFRATSVAVIGASTRPQRVGSTVLADLMTAGFKGDIYRSIPNTPQSPACIAMRQWRNCPHAPISPSSAHRRQRYRPSSRSSAGGAVVPQWF